MVSKIPQRLLWAVETLAVQPDDHLLEIGCGHGIAAALICEKLQTGTITAIDRSDKMIAIAQTRNQQCIESGRASFHITSLNEVDLGSKRFNKIFAVNVNVFWLNPEREVTVIKKLLAPGGTCYLVYEPPDPAKAREIAEKVRQHLLRHNFTIQQTLFCERPPLNGVCITAQR